MSRIVVLELLQALKFKSPLPDTNLLLLVQVELKNTKQNIQQLSGASLFILPNTLLKLSAAFLSLFVQILAHAWRNPPSSRST